MAKIVKTIVKLQIPAGKANPAPPVGTALGPQGVNIMEFCTDFNKRTAELDNVIVPIVMRVYEDRSFDYDLKKPPVADAIKRRLKLEKASQTPGKGNAVAKLTQKDLREIAEEKMPDLNARTIEAAMKVVEGTARSMGVDVAKD